MDASRHAPAAPGRRWYSTTFRLLTVYAATFSISVMVLLGFIAAAITHDMERETDVVIDWQMIYFDAMPDGDIAGAIHRRLEHERMHTNYYGLFSANGTHIAGDVLAFPSELTTYRTGTTLDHTLKIAGDQVAPVVRAMAEVRANGDKLVLARDLTHILRIREAIINALIGGGVLCLVAGIAGGLALSVRQMSRLKAIRHVTQRIAQGDLGQRLPVGGRDEIDMLSHLVNHMLEEVERLMNEVKGVCDGIAHDLRTPLAHVHTLLAHAAQRADTLDDVALSSLVERARTETDGLLARFRAMLRISEIGTLQRRGGFAALQQRHEHARVEIGRDKRERQLRDAHVVERGDAHHRAVFRYEHAARVNAIRAARIGEFPRARGAVRYRKQAVLAELGRIVRRAVAREIGRRRDCHLADRRQRAAHERRAREMAIVGEAHVVRAFDHVDVRIERRHVERDARVQDAVRGEQRPEARGGEAHRRRDAQRAARIARRLHEIRFDFVELVDDRAAAVQVLAAGLGERQAARCAVQQAHVQMGFQHADAARDGRGRHAELSRGEVEAREIDHAREDAHHL
ncbi:HAMP domain protein [Burkholderia thailandensis E264]|uniref:histidine kinase n=1 Tax=Burkholderia thailandensis (strain ATCC 700388 / DSM 13276 / CCUG 48851 / CIP 106301 / E264) TaxID=271848 RepID=Q2T1W6_BURTA|nr:sensor histidine kinase [Burkholderia thailandensis E264]AHI74427.1 HAMP domain protein [Burkholderia thailandensis 2002721723]AIP25506.1 HAMP domain protein [Burkholderia thailandensis E264]AJX98239.1 HAMP domain protein [Burkholderia thailandensis 2002721643]